MAPDAVVAPIPRCWRCRSSILLAVILAVCSAARVGAGAAAFAPIGTPIVRRSVAPSSSAATSGPLDRHVVLPARGARGVGRGGRRSALNAGADGDKKSGYVPPPASAMASSRKTPPSEKRKKRGEREPPYPQIGDVVRYYDLDGGKTDGQVLVGKLVLIQPILTDKLDEDAPRKYLAEVVELDDVGEGYYADYPSRERRSRKSLRKLEELAPVPASYVRSADAYRIPVDPSTNRPRVSFEGYKLDDYGGPAAIPVDEEVLESDGERYDKLKGQLLKDAAVVGLAGTAVARGVGGNEGAVIYAAGALAGVAYLFLLSVKTDTVGSPDAKLGNNVSNVRFLLPLFVLLGVALYNTFVTGADADALASGSYLSTVSREQFGAAVLGFVTYRVPLFLRQLQPDGDAEDASGGGGPVALQMLQGGDGGEAATAGVGASELVRKGEPTPVLLVCGPGGTGKTGLVEGLVGGDDRFVVPRWTDRIAEGPRFEVMEARGQFLKLDDAGRFGLTGEAILSAAAAADGVGAGEDGDSNEEGGHSRVVVVDADVDLAEKLTKLAGARIIGVWVGLDSLDKFKERIQAQIEAGQIKVPPDESEESLLRAKMRQAVKDIEYGVVSGIFEFTILNDDFDESLKELKAAAEYCFK